MDDDDVWAAIDLQRSRTVELLDSLSEDDWRQSSLCAGWTVRDVAAHLTLQELGLTDALRSLLRNPGSLGGLNRTIRLSARKKAELPPAQLMDELRAMVGSRRHNVGVTIRETLINALVHAQDIAIPLQREHPMPTEAAAVAATRVWSYGGRGHARVFDAGWTRGHRFRATDTDWARGEGPEVAGPMSAILLLLTGRRAALPQLTGAGADALRSAPAARATAAGHKP